MKKKCCCTIHGNRMGKKKRKKIMDRRKRANDGVGGPIRRMNYGETKRKSKSHVGFIRQPRTSFYMLDCSSTIRAP